MASPGITGTRPLVRTTLEDPNFTPNNSRIFPNANGGAMHSLNIAGDMIFINPNTKVNGDGWASFLLGAMNPGGSWGATEPFKKDTVHYYGAFIQDVVRTNPKSYPGVQAPGLKNLDFNVGKFFDLTERFRLELKLPTT